MYKIGPGESSLIASAMTNRTGESKNKVRTEKTISRARLIMRPDADRQGIWSGLAGNCATHSTEA
jgi:hypothetical protein